MFQDLLLPPDAACAKMDALGAENIPFFFMANAWAEQWIVLPCAEAQAQGFYWDLNGMGNLERIAPPAQVQFEVTIPSFQNYKTAFSRVNRAQRAGDCWLANLTFPSFVNTNLSVREMAQAANASFRLYAAGHFAVFSPERFVSISKNGEIATFPMKGTIDASVPHASEKILSDEKEQAEHVTIVDLLRNDLGRIAKGVHVPQYRFLTQVHSQGKTLLQVSSEVRGHLNQNWPAQLGQIFRALTPAGSVTGAPKKRTVELIREAEIYDRGWYTGVFGCFDGHRVDSAVMIRFLEQSSSGRSIYKSGGGITIYSDPVAEYEELEAKVYAPFG
ncbi:MAG: aminodeoxychorismate synthase component I [Spirochaetales bacterium]|nr:aminodeoxychorismate synthase component I [Spirochaetales bacterium]